MLRRTHLAPLLCGLILALLAGPIDHKGALAAQKPPAPTTLTIKDDVGRTVVLKLPIRRSVIFNGATTELLRLVAGLGTVVGVDGGTIKFDHDYWPGLNDSMIVGQGQSAPNYEAVIAKQPDVVFFPRNGDYLKAIEVLKPFGIPVVVLTAWDLERNDFNVDLLGRIYQRQDQARKLTDMCHGYRALLNKRLVGVRRKKVYLEQEPSYTTVLKGSGWHDMIQDAGADNLFAEIMAGDKPTARGNNQVYQIDPEQILIRKPDLIVKLEPESYKPMPRATSTAMLKSIAARPGFDQLEAVQKGQVYYLSRMLTHGCSKLIGSIQLAKWLYPERFKDVDPDQEVKDWMELQSLPSLGGYWASLAQVR